MLSFSMMMVVVAPLVEDKLDCVWIVAAAERNSFVEKAYTNVDLSYVPWTKRPFIGSLYRGRVDREGDCEIINCDVASQGLASK